MSQTQYLSNEKFEELKKELNFLRKTRKTELAKKIDDARQMGDLSENAEYHAAREELSWVLSRIKEIEHILDTAELISGKKDSNSIGIGSVITVEINDKEKKYTIVGAQEANPLLGKISNESPLGSAFLGKKVGDTVKVWVPAGAQEYKILSIE